jgi:hypothetical protein
MIFLLSALTLLAFLFSPSQSGLAPRYDTLFTGATMRVDYFHTGGRARVKRFHSTGS